jgi:hypothetical protein
LLVYPRTGAVTLFSVGAKKKQQSSTPVLFSLSYFGYHNPESKSIRLTATKQVFPPAVNGRQGSVRLGGRTVAMTSQTQGVFHNPVTTVSWNERGDSILVTAEGLTVSPVDRFIKGLTEREPLKQ